MVIPVSKPSIKRQDMDAVLSCLVEDNLGTASAAQEFLEKLSSYFGRAGAVTLREPRRGIELLFGALGVDGDATVVLSPLLPQVYRDVLGARGVAPRLVDVWEDGTIRLDQVAEIHPDVLVVDAPLGHVPDVEQAGEIAGTVIEDVSAGLGARIGEKLLGTFGDYTVLFLEPEHLITAGGGIALLGRGRKEKQALAAQAARLPAASRMTDVNSALGLTQLRSLQAFLDRRSRIVEHYIRSLARSRHKSLPSRGVGTGVPFAFPVVVESNPKEAVEYAKKKHVEVAYAFEGSVLEALLKEAAATEAAATEAAGGSASSDRGHDESDPPGAGAVGIDLNALPTAERLVRRCVTFPLYPMLTSEQIETVGRVIATLP
jgi:dTDP-4-amino-4,6-dideoxygalactose transaminase